MPLRIIFLSTCSASEIIPLLHIPLQGPLIPHPISTFQDPHP
uniref:Uncharacterized protein n=1 Tax=Rhizophora mucronata TaxID=61149 RepID=A0A2P2P8X5_RHIMU